ncbi:TM2 domain-containing protein [Alicyclobacillus fastidiosus]|uniref:TM2 domain-containing protein n=1 Tax=Alicyclobacillus fastidiosus TaxID=392011 RepID=A0ABV5ALF3_9BACL|nr:TM2 domain-containing protein [Alicyclobacillus fastidiosus]WEH10999.1 TM2 domain-containing protein [Alicyclobacillus fastidiosus]
MSMNLAAKQNMDARQLALLQSEYDGKKKSAAVAWILWLFLGAIGAHRYYMGYIGRGIVMTLTAGGLGIWSLFDAFFIQGGLRKKNQKIEMEIINAINMGAARQPNMYSAGETV